MVTSEEGQPLPRPPGRKGGRFSPLGDASPQEYVQALPSPAEAFLPGFSQTSHGCQEGLRTPTTPHTP